MRLSQAICVAGVLWWSTPASADNICLSWSSVPGSDGYKLYASVNNGETWAVASSPTQTSVCLDVAGDKLVLFRVSAVKGDRESLSEAKGAWYNGALRGWPNDLVVR